jgi:hypothetical protein
MEPNEVRNKVAVAVGLKLGVDHEKARIVGDSVLRIMQECGLITISAGELARVNELVRAGQAVNAMLVETLTRIAALDTCPGCGGSILAAEIAAAALKPDADVIEGELAPAHDA